MSAVGDAGEPGRGRTALVTGATGFVGSRLAKALAARGWRVRCLVRDPSRAAGLAEREFELHRGDVLDPGSLEGAGEGVEVAYYLVHAMGRGGSGDFEDLERRAARNFAEMAKREGVERVVYLGGLGDQPRSKHLRSRRRTAELLAEHGPPLTYFRAGMVVGGTSESYRTLRYLVQRLPAMIAPAWLSTPTQPIAIDDVVAYLARAPDVVAAGRGEIQIGGPDVLSYGDMLDRMAEALGIRPRRRVPVPLLTPWLSSLWIGLVTPVDAGVARPLVEGLSTPTTVTDPSGAAPFGIDPIGFTEALRRAIDEDPEVASARDLRRAAATRGDSFRPGAWPGRGGEPSGAPASGGIGSSPRSQDAGPGRTRVLALHFPQVPRPDSGGGWPGRSHRAVRARNPGRATPLRPTDPGALGGEWLDHLADRWRIAGFPAGPEGGFLRLTLERPPASESARLPTLYATMEVRGVHPSLRGEGRLAPLGPGVYAATQRRVHRTITRGFLRSLAGLGLTG